MHVHKIYPTPSFVCNHWERCQYLQIKNIEKLKIMATEKFCLTWNDYENNIGVAFRDLREEKEFFDVTLACEDEQVEAHKVILSSCSPFFQNRTRFYTNKSFNEYLWQNFELNDLQTLSNV